MLDQAEQLEKLHEVEEALCTALADEQKDMAAIARLVVLLREVRACILRMKNAA